MYRIVCFLIATLLLFSPPSFAAPDKYTFDKDHTHILFFVSHVGYSQMIGRIRDFDGSLAFDEKNPKSSSVDVTLKPASVDTDVPALNAALQSEKFFNTVKFPTIHFKSTSVTLTGPKTGDVTGDLTLLGVTKPVVLHVTYNRSGVHPLTNNYVSGFSADASLRRSDFGMTAYAPDTVGDVVRIHIEAEGTDVLKHPGNVKTVY